MQKLTLPSHPKALWYLSANQAFYSFSLFAIISFLIIYLRQNLGFPAPQAYQLFAGMVSLMYIFPIAGGYIGEKLGYCLVIITGFIVAFLGCLALVIHGIHFVYLGMASFAIGNALIIPNINALVGLHYDEKSVLRTSAYTFYLLIYNIGSLFAPLLAGFVSESNAALVFLTAGVGVLVALALFVYSIKNREMRAGFTIPPQVKGSLTKRLSVLISLLLITLIATFFLLKQQNFGEKLLCILIFCIVVSLSVSARNHDRSRRLKTFTFLSLCILAIAFWSLYMLLPSFLTVFISQNVNRNVLGLNMPPSAYYALDAFFVIVLGFFFTWLWRYCAERNKNTSFIIQFGLSLFMISAAYFVFAWGTFNANPMTYLVNSGWIVLAYICVAAGELLISPIALAMIGILLPKTQQGLGMGIWQAFIGFSAIVSGFLANLVDIPEHSQANPLVTNPLYMHAFLKMGISTLVIGTIIFLCVPKIRKFLNL